jgi:hypothetical protein
MEKRKVVKNIIFPVGLYGEAKDISRDLNINFSKLVREALIWYLRLIRKKKIEEEIELAAKANEGFYAKLSEDYKHIDAEPWT